MQTGSRTATFIVGFMVLCAFAILTYAARTMHPLNYRQFFSLLAMALVASRLKVKLPGLNGNMSVNVPFILMALAQLSLFEALLVALPSVMAQCFPKNGGKLKPVQMLFNVSTMAAAVGAAFIFQAQLLILAGAGFFLAQTLPVATIISLTERGRVLRIWSSIAHLSFPYFVLSAGITSIVTAASHLLGWEIPLLVLPVMYAVYRSYQLYFGQPVSISVTRM